jgi:predicted RNA binding protein YcfA (HicA-like mRNA interferase family)
MKARELIKIVEDLGWYEVRQKGSHKIFQNAEQDFNIVIPDHGAKDLGVGLVSKILKQAGLK